MKAFSEAMKINLSIQLMSMALGIRKKFDLQLAMEMSAATVISGRLSKDIKLAQVKDNYSSFTNNLERHIAVESLNQGFSVAKGNRFDATQLLGQITGDMVGDKLSEVIGNAENKHFAKEANAKRRAASGGITSGSL